MYDGKRLIPAPLVTVAKEYQTAADGTKVGSLFGITLNGTIVAYKGSPDSSGNFYTGGGNYPPDGRDDPTYNETINNDSRLTAILRKQEAIRDLFSEDGKQLEFQAFDADQPMKCNPRIQSINFEEGRWYNICQYTIQCEADVLSVDGVLVGEDDYTEYISSAQETWAIESVEQPEGLGLPRTYRMTHSVQAQGKRYYDDTGALVADAWKQARDWVTPRLGFDSAYLTSSGVKDLTSDYTGYNHVRSENIDEVGGSYSITETWLVASGTALEEFTVNVRTSQDGLTTVGIDGNITGLEERDSDLDLTTSKWDNALTKFTAVSGVAYTRAKSYSGINTLNITPLSTTVGKNPIAGTISYGFEFDSRPSNCVNGAKSEVISLNDSFGVDVFASIPVLGRVKGPVLQDIGTHQATTRALSIELVMDTPGTGCDVTTFLFTKNPRRAAATSGDIQAIINAASPATYEGASQTFVSNRSENWEPKTGRYSYNIEWTYEV